jgi:hypothetical protein
MRPMHNPALAHPDFRSPALIADRERRSASLPPAAHALSLHESSIRIPAIRTGSLVLTCQRATRSPDHVLQGTPLASGADRSVWKEGDTGAVETAVSLFPFSLPFIGVLLS